MTISQPRNTFFGWTQHARGLRLDHSLGTWKYAFLSPPLYSLRSQFNARHLFNSWITRTTMIAAEIPQRQSSSWVGRMIISLTKKLEPCSPVSLLLRLLSQGGPTAIQSLYIIQSLCNTKLTFACNDSGSCALEAKVRLN